MNSTNILAVASAIENRAIWNLGFNMARFVTSMKTGDDGEYTDHTGQGCGTTACIAGWAFALMHGRALMPEMSGPWIARNAGDWLGLGHGQRNELFYATDRGVNVSLSELTDVQAIKTLRHLAAAGEVDWKLP